MTPDEFYRSLVSLIENAPEGIDTEVLEHLTAASDSMSGDMKEEMSPGQKAAQEAMPEDMMEEDAKESYQSPGKEAAIMAAKK